MIHLKWFSWGTTTRNKPGHLEQDIQVLPRLNREFVIATCSNLGGFRGMWSGVAPLQPGGFSNDITVGSVGKNRQECTHISLAKENSASPGPSEEKEMAMVTRGLRTMALRKKTIERNTGLQWDKPPRKATWSWSHPAPHALLATWVEPKTFAVSHESSSNSQLTPRKTRNNPPHVLHVLHVRLPLLPTHGDLYATRHLRPAFEVRFCKKFYSHYPGNRAIAKKLVAWAKAVTVWISVRSCIWALCLTKSGSGQLKPHEEGVALIYELFKCTIVKRFRMRPNSFRPSEASVSTNIAANRTKQPRPLKMNGLEQPKMRLSDSKRNVGSTKASHQRRNPSLQLMERDQARYRTSTCHF
ncbi:hypothetical protein C8R45DRAFT_941243 [Mycena sanguinolenta]|nr:hypothetical protein C8R45DRAFT_941243 [Mycena sanguinolenta]